MVSETLDETERAPSKDPVVQGETTEWKILMENQDYSSAPIRHRLVVRAALTFPDLTQEIVLDMTGHAKNLSMWLRGHFPDMVPPAILEVFKDNDKSCACKRHSSLDIAHL